MKTAMKYSNVSVETGGHPLWARDMRELAHSGGAHTTNCVAAMLCDDRQSCRVLALSW